MMKVIKHALLAVCAAPVFCMGTSVAGTLQASADGTATDSATGLTWMRCIVGQTWTGTACLGDPPYSSLDQIRGMTGTTSFAGQNDWRLPTIRELMTLVDYTLPVTGVDRKIFLDPSNINSFFLSSTTGDGNNPDYGFAWVGVSGGGNNSAIVTSTDVSYVRMVRGAANASMNLARPTADYTPNSNGTVLHKPTQLTWQRCMVGQTWTGSACSGSASTLTWTQARALTSSFAGQSDWRLPTALELDSLVDYTKSFHTINTDVFPENDPELYVWSGSTSAVLDSDPPVQRYTWGVSFKYGGLSSVDTLGNSTDRYGVRLVRSAPPVNEATELFAWAEAQFSNLFPLPAESGVFANYTYRFYPASGLVLAVQNRQVYGFGDAATNRQMLNLTAAVCIANPALALCKPATP